jgi:formate-dependent nitrite reductase cytochrome c552 subunit
MVKKKLVNQIIMQWDDIKSEEMMEQYYDAHHIS